ncbi:MAG: transposase [Vampirovibrio sp.]
MGTSKMACKPLTDSQWAPHILKQKMGRPRTLNREILEAILFVLSTHCRWEELPPCFPPKMTVFTGLKYGKKGRLRWTSRKIKGHETKPHCQ